MPIFIWYRISDNIGDLVAECGDEQAATDWLATHDARVMGDDGYDVKAVIRGERMTVEEVPTTRLVLRPEGKRGKK